PPPTSTLFPYTTLFRSYQHPDVRVVPAEDDRLGAADTTYRVDPRHHSLRRRLLVAGSPVDLTSEEQMVDRLRLKPRRELRRRKEDRKSTRLNSSHVSIS